jgi:hypothetical protein
MVKMILVIIALLMASQFLPAQQGGAGKKFRFGSQNYIGILEGEDGGAFQVQTVNGVRYKDWFAGIGTGLDYYYVRSIPLFLSVNKFFNFPKAPVFINGDIGINFPWDKAGAIYFDSAPDYSPSLYWAGGLGYKFALKKKSQGVLLNLGYSYKHVIEQYKLDFPCLLPPCPGENDRYDYRLKRLSLKVGWMF